MTLDEAIKHCHEKAEEIRKANEEMPTDCKLSEDLCECAKEHEQLAAWLEELAERREADRWIPVSERLPEIATACLVQLSNGHITIGKYHSIRGGSWAFIDTGIQYVYPKDSVIAWKALPEPHESEGVRNEVS